MTHYVYILSCADSTLYVGYTNDIEKRVHTHNTSKQGARYTKARRPVVLRYAEEYPNKSVALKRENEIKSWPRARKLSLFQV